MPTWNEIHAKFNQPNSSKSAWTINPAWNFVSMLGNLIRDPPPPVFGPLTTYSIGGVGHISANAAANIINEAETLCVGTGAQQHTLVKANAIWRNMYGYALRPVNKIDNGGFPAVYPGVPTMPCHYCGIILPMELIQVDHQKPKAAGTRGAAILKVLHSLPSAILVPLTVGNSTGNKGMQAGAIHGALHGGGAPAVINPKNRAGFGLAFGAAGLGGLTGGGVVKDNQYALTPEGNTFLSIWRMMVGINRVEMTCVNSIMNLAPACAFCNGASGKGGNLFYK